MRSFLAILVTALAFGLEAAHAGDAPADVQARFMVFMPREGAAQELGAQEVVRLASNTPDGQAGRIDIFEDTDGMRAALRRVVGFARPPSRAGLRSPDRRGYAARRAC